MLTTAVVLFVVAALGGLFMAVRIFQGRKPPRLVAALHGIAAASGLLVLLWAVVNSERAGTAGIALVVLVVAALGGFYLLGYDLRDRAHPRPVVVLHALLAVAGVGTLVYAIA